MDDEGGIKGLMEDPNRREEYIEELMTEIDAQVRQLADVFRFVLKYRIMFRGSGIEFAGLREYIPGQDDAIRIDWKASLRANKLYIKQFLFYLLVISSTPAISEKLEKPPSNHLSVQLIPILIEKF